MSLEKVSSDEQPWYTADDGAVAREIASPRNSRARQISIADIKVAPGVAIKTHYHAVIEEIYFVTAGSGVMVIGEQEQRVEAGDAIVIRPGERHSIRNDADSELRLLVTCNPPWTPECLIFD